MIDGITNAGALPALERMLQFTGARQRLIAHNLANLSTPNFRPVDVSPQAFQAQLAEAVDARRSAGQSNHGPLQIASSRQVKATDTSLTLQPEPTGDNILFHDNNDRDLERIMQRMVENFMAFRTAAQLIKGRFEIINTALRERV